MLQLIYFIIILISSFSFLFSNTISGTILNDENNPLQGTTIILSSDKNVYIGISDVSGYYHIKDVVKDSYNLKISYLGYVNISDIIDLKGNIVKDYMLIKSLINFNQVVVTGSKKESFIKDSPLLTHVITNDDIKISPYVSAKGALELIFPNMQTIHGEHGNAGRLKAQGLDSKYTAFLVDGVKVNGEFAGNIDLSMLNLVNVERIEYINGAMSTLYGSAAIGGVVNIITSKKNKPFWSKVSLFNDKPLSHSKSLNIGFQSKFIYYEGSMIYKESPGYNLKIDRNGSGTQTLDPYDDQTYLHRLLFTINDNMYLDINSRYYNSKSMKKTEIDWGGTNVTVLSTQPKYSDTTYTAKFVKNFNNKSEINIILSNEKYNKKYFYPYYYDGSNPFVQNGEEFVSALYEKDDLSFIYKFTLNSNSFIIGADNSKDTYSSFNIYDPNYSHVFDNFNNQCESITIGGQLKEECLSESIFSGQDATKEKAEKAIYIYNNYKHNNNEISFGIRNVSHSSFDDKTIGSLTYLNRLKNNYDVRFSIGQGYRIPSIKELYYDWPNHAVPLYGSLDLKASESYYISISLDKRTYNQFSINLFSNYIKDMISTTLITNSNDIQELHYENVDNVTINGVTMHYARDLTNNMLLKFVYNFTYPKSISNEVLEGISKHAIRIQYLLKLSEYHSFIMNFKYQGKKNNYNQRTSEIKNLEDFWLIDALWSISMKKFEILCGIKNIFNFKDSILNRIDNDILSSYDPGRRVFININFNL